jgi:DegV family protein with EDD domain
VLCITLSAEYSGTYGAAVNAAELAATALPGVRIEVLDAGGLAMAHGFAVLEAARAAQAGATPEEAMEIARAVAGRAEMAGVLDTMRYLAKSGRVPWVVGWAASLLRIKPVVAFDGGKARSIGRVRTSAKGMDELLRYVHRKAGKTGGMHMAIMNAGAPGRARELADRVGESFGPKELMVAEFTAVMGVHTGPGFLGVAFYSDEGIPLRTPPPRRRRWLLERDARVLEDALGPLPKPVETPAVVVLSGLPGAGKSHLARELIKRYSFAHMESDRLRQALFERPSYTQAENPAIQRLPRGAGPPAFQASPSSVTQRT